MGVMRAEAQTVRWFPDYNAWIVYTKLSLRTFSNRVVSDVLTTNEDFTAENKKAGDEKVSAAHPNATRLSSASPKYNCHSYAWQDSSTNNVYWIDSPAAYISDPHTAKSHTPFANAIAVYTVGNQTVHSAVVTGVNGNTITCVSKWGPSGLYRHELGYLPDEYLENGKPNVTYYRINYVHSGNGSVGNTSRAGHTVGCSVCGQSFVEPHVYRVTATTLNTHTRICNICSYVVTEEHQLNSMRTRCLVCGKEGPFPVDLHTIVVAEEPLHGHEACQECPAA